MNLKKLVFIAVAFAIVIGSATLAAYAQGIENTDGAASMDVSQEESDNSAAQEDVSDMRSEADLSDTANDLSGESVIADPSETVFDGANEAEDTAMDEDDNIVTQIAEETSQQTDHPAERTVWVTTSCDTDVLRLGSCITLTANLEGYEGLVYTCQWQYATADREGNIVSEWQDAQENGLTVSYVLTETNILTAWRVRVIVVE